MNIEYRKMYRVSVICNKRNIFCNKDKFNVALYDANGLIVRLKMEKMLRVKYL